MNKQGGHDSSGKTGNGADQVGKSEPETNGKKGAPRKPLKPMQSRDPANPPHPAKDIDEIDHIDEIAPQKRP